MIRLSVLALLAVLLVHPGLDAQPSVPGVVREFPSPADSGSSLPFLATMPDGRVVMSWVGKTVLNRYALKYSILDDTTWTAPRTIAEGENWFVNWADFPSVLPLDDGSFAAHWLERIGEGKEAYGIRISRSNSGGIAWSPPVTPHLDRTETEHGFVSMFPVSGGRVGAIWLDGRDMAVHYVGNEVHAGAMTLRYAAVGPDGSLSDEMLLDSKVCECCQTSAAVSTAGPIVAYRDRLEGNIRDIAVVRQSAGSWGTPKKLSADGWKLDGCPVNGPAIDAQGNEVAVAWFTAASAEPRVMAALSSDGGRTFGAPIVLDDKSPVGRVDVAILPGRGAAVSWIARSSGSGEIRVRTIDPDGTLGGTTVVAAPGAARANGFPRMARAGSKLVIGWTAEKVRTSIIPRP